VVVDLRWCPHGVHRPGAFPRNAHVRISAMSRRSRTEFTRERGDYWTLEGGAR